MVQIDNKLIADLKRIAKPDTKITEYHELGGLIITEKKRKINSKSCRQKEKETEQKENQGRYY